MPRNARLTELFNEQSGWCAYCRTKMTLDTGRPDTATKDHIIPTSAMGSVRVKDSFNIVAACSACNQKKSNLPLSVFLGKMFK
jgi:5-methylcytosine-specific restriction endonuclease McrA